MIKICFLTQIDLYAIAATVYPVVYPQFLNVQKSKEGRWMVTQKRIGLVFRFYARVVGDCEMS